MLVMFVLMRMEMMAVNGHDGDGVVDGDDGDASDDGVACDDGNVGDGSGYGADW